MIATKQDIKIGTRSINFELTCDDNYVLDIDLEDREFKLTTYDNDLEGEEAEEAIKKLAAFLEFLTSDFQELREKNRPYEVGGKAKAKDDVVILFSKQLKNGTYVATVHCDSRKDYEELPRVISFRIRHYGKSKWDRSARTAIYRSDADFGFKVR